MGNILFFTKRQLAVIVVVGLVTGLLDDRVEMLEFATVANVHPLLVLNDYLAYVTGGPVFGDLLQNWLEFGGVLAVCLVRKPGAGTIALTINGICQVFAHGTHDPHLLYGVPGLGVDLVFAASGYKRYDVAAVALAGVAAAMFWYPIVWFTHGIYLYPASFILADFALRVAGGAVGDGLLAGGIALLVFGAVGRRWDETPALVFGGREADGLVYASGLLVASVGVLIVVLTSAVGSVARFFLSIGPKIAPGNPMLEEYNPGYIIGIVLIFLVAAMLLLWSLRSAYSVEQPI